MQADPGSAHPEMWLDSSTQRSLGFACRVAGMNLTQRLDAHLDFVAAPNLSKAQLPFKRPSGGDVSDLEGTFIGPG
jgi:hypothetical protein